MRKKASVLCFAALLTLALTATAYAGDGGLSPAGPDSPNAARAEDIYWLLLAISGTIFILVEGALLLFIFRFRNRGRPTTAEGPQIHGATRLELIWTAVPVLILAAIVAFVFYKLPGINDVPSARAGSSNLKVKVEGHQFYWNFIYPNGVIQVKRMRAPVNRVVELRITSPDVDHSWWIPPLGGKFDALPGKTNHTWFKVGRKGTYEGRCGEFCGMQHALMIAKVQVIDGSDFDRWLDEENRAQQAGTSDLGKMTFEGACAPCHGTKGQGDVGPKLQGNSLTQDANAIETLLRHGRGQMPAVGQGWRDRQMNALTSYLKIHFKNSGGGGGG